MSAVLPTPEQYAAMSWPARMEAAKRVRKILAARAYKQRLKDEAVLIAKAVQAEAAVILANLPREPDELIAERRAIVATYNHYGRRQA